MITVTIIWAVAMVASLAVAWRMAMDRYERVTKERLSQHYRDVRVEINDVRRILQAQIEGQSKDVIESIDAASSRVMIATDAQRADLTIRVNTLERTLESQQDRQNDAARGALRWYHSEMLQPALALLAHQRPPAEKEKEEEEEKRKNGRLAADKARAEEIWDQVGRAY